MKKKTLKGAVVIALGLAMAVSLAACKKQTAGGREGPITLTFWHSMGASPSAPVIKSFIAQYMKDHPNITIIEESVPEADYQEKKLPVAISTFSQGDIFHSYGGGQSRPFVDRGAIYQLDDYFTKNGVFDQLQDGVLTYMTYDDKTYGIPLTRWAGVLFCNTDFFNKYNVPYPETWEQLLAAIKTFRNNGVTPMAMGGKDSWAIAMLYNALAVRTAGTEYLNRALVGETSLDTPEIVRSAELFQELVRSGAFDPNSLGISYYEATMDFALGKIPMYYMGSWLAAEATSQENNVEGKLKIMPLPVVSGGKGDENQFLGSATACYMINSHSKYPEEAAAFAVALAKHQAAEAYKLGDDMPCWKVSIPDADVNPVLLEINKVSEDASGYVLAWDTILTGVAITAHYDLVQQLLGLQVTPAEFARQTQAFNVQALAEQAASRQ
jgi:raffinose/stachyose/melibiose transport system substrate-binding protein